MADCKLEYITLSGRVKFQNASIKERQVEMPDGNHLVTSNCMSFDPDGKGQPVMTIFQGVTAPWGSYMFKEQMENAIYDITVKEQAMKPQSINRMWVRWLTNGMDWMMKHGWTLLILMFVAGVMISYFMGGGAQP